MTTVAGDMPRRVLVTGVSRFLGLRLAKQLEEDPTVEHVVGVDLDDPPIPVRKLEFVRADIGNPLIARVIQASRIDTLVHTNISSRASLLGGRSAMKENNVIGTMQLLAAAQRSQRLRKVVMKSSAAVYGFDPREPSILPEDQAARQVDLSGYAKDCAEAETYARDFGRRRSDVELVVLRTQNVVGPTVKTNMTDYLGMPVIPTALGYDPRLQLLHETDAVEALHKAMAPGVRGIFNVAADGVVYLSQAIRLLRKVPLPILLPSAQTAATVVRRLGFVDFPTDQLGLILFGRVVDTARAEQILGFKARYTTEACIKDFRDHRERDYVLEPHLHPAWERELFDYLARQKSSQGRTS